MRVRGGRSGTLNVWILCPNDFGGTVGMYRDGFRNAANMNLSTVR
jgi:hypothetical protein